MTVTVCVSEPATSVEGVIDAMVGVGFCCPGGGFLVDTLGEPAQSVIAAVTRHDRTSTAVRTGPEIRIGLSEAIHVGIPREYAVRVSPAAQVHVRNLQNFEKSGEMRTTVSCREILTRV